MRRARFRDPAGSVRTGEWTDDGIVAAGRTHDVEAIDLLPPVEPTKVIGCGLNYRSRFEGTDEEPPSKPHIWWKGGPNVVSGPGDTVPLPNEECIFEGELGVVIGEQCRNVDEPDVGDAVAGYTCVNDLSNEAHFDDPTMIRMKSFDNSAAIGPVVAPPDRVPDDPRIRSWVDGELRQDSAGDGLIYGVPEVVAECSRHFTLEPGDVVMMGTPEGAGDLEDGNRIEIEVEGVGRLEHRVSIP